jgi:membrane-associated protein
MPTLSDPNYSSSNMSTIIDLFLHLDTHLEAIIGEYGALTYLLLFLIIFCETGLVIMPFLPGDSLLFAAGTFAARGSFNIALLFLLMSIAAIGGNTLNFMIGRALETKAYQKNLIKESHLKRTELFFKKHGGKTIVLSRFAPIIRTIAPFVAGVGQMPYSKFMLSNVIGGLLWITLFLFGGYFFGAIPAVEKNFTLVMLGIVVISFLPVGIEWYRHRASSRHS